MLHGTICNDDFLRNTAEQCCNYSKQFRNYGSGSLCKEVLTWADHNCSQAWYIHFQGKSQGVKTFVPSIFRAFSISDS